MGELPATEQDIRDCYRLLLSREPDSGGLRHWRELVSKHHITVRDLVNGFLVSDEFAARNTDPEAPVRVDLAGFSIYIEPDDFLIGRTIQRDRAYEPTVTEVIEHVLPADGVFVDVGANIGYFTLLAASRVGVAGQVHAFEPNPHNCTLLRESVRYNGFRTVHVHEAAVTETPGTVQLVAPGQTSNGRIRIGGAALPGTIDVPAVTLDGVLRDLRRLDLAKLDIEGAEPLAFRGMKTLLMRHRPVIVFEFCPSFIQGTSGCDPGEFLRELDRSYRLRVLDSPGDDQGAPRSPEEIVQICVRRGGLNPMLNLAGHPR